ncbi:CRISPR-associated endoribonuclease Cse3 [Austwickia sp. TVS 96-490-7B]|uniref:type I-E CRISPR-associated protein Cas6/Cse3/CasE n=1 Tax=Austwickia sp. TVS 96-490-7B TaxID=2830843 RepID=UPI001C572727|nr:type I-E CRISPR-associated protein Cas6/Cse3/CasE [Austwickia sp. TVS 96-490-7B]MBW3084716.1 CRISPR-associated endoribonuclease Cse3 [Austwickia sp. TVS 96-490-7B]
MYLTRFPINVARRGARHLLVSQQRMHAAVLASFPPDGDLPRALWRVDSGDHRTDLFIMSPSRPDLTHLVEQAGWPSLPDMTWNTADYLPFLERLEAGQRWAFRLTANPVRSVPVPGGSRGQVKAHVAVAHQQKWLLSRTDQLGFTVPNGPHGQPQVVVKDRRTARFERRHAESGRDVTVAMATFDGVLDVTDAGRLRQALTHGVGRAKSYGCGLLTLARL